MSGIFLVPIPWIFGWTNIIRYSMEFFSVQLTCRCSRESKPTEHLRRTSSHLRPVCSTTYKTKINEGMWCQRVKNNIMDIKLFLTLYSLLWLDTLIFFVFYKWLYLFKSFKYELCLFINFKYSFVLEFYK